MMENSFEKKCWVKIKFMQLEFMVVKDMNNDSLVFFLSLFFSLLCCVLSLSLIFYIYYIYREREQQRMRERLREARKMKLTIVKS